MSRARDATAGAPLTDKVIVETEGAIGWLTFNNPERHNALTLGMWQAIPQVIERFEADEAVRVIVLKGAGEKAFISGADISEFEAQRASTEQVAEYDDIVKDASTRLAGAKKPTIAMIRGYCIGGGLAVAISCDMRIAAEGSRFAIPAAKLGIGYRLSSMLPLVELVGPAFAKEIVITARQFGANEALHMGLINRLLPDDELDAYVRSYCDRIAANAPLSMAAAKGVVGEIVRAREGVNNALCEQLVKACFESEDYVEGRRAFMEKRKPKFRGR